MTDGLLSAIGGAVADSLLSGGNNAPSNPNWTEVKELGTFPGDYKPSESETKSLLALVNKAELGDKQRAALLEHHVAFRKESDTALSETFKTETAKWATEAKNQLGTKADEALKAANGVLEKFGSKELVGLLQQTGLSNRIEVVNFLAKIAENTPAGGNQQQQQATVSAGGGDGENVVPLHVRLFGRGGN